MAAPTILFRKDYSTEDELDIAKQYFHVVEYRAECQDQLVIPRYSALPYYKELEYDLSLHNCHMINSLREHRWIADFEWYNELREFTPETWFDHNFHECKHQGPFVVKGRTNSKKLYWSSQMFAPTRRDALKIAGQLTQNEYLAQQGIVYRKYEPLVLLEEGLNGLPFSHEFRFFFLRDKMLCNGFYWSSASKVDYPVPKEAVELAHKVAGIAMQYANFFVVDVAEKASGGWTLIELNDGQMSGLSECDPHELYKNLAEALIPQGPYCYSHPLGRGKCPYWDLDLRYEYQDNGYCHMLHMGDWESTTASLLWDQVKECGINLDEADDE